MFSVTNKVKFPVIISLFFLIPVSISAQSNNQDSIQHMKEVEVRAGSLEGQLTSELAKYGNQVNVVTGEEIEKAGINDLGQALEKLVPGVHVTPNFGRNTDLNISIQGSRNRDVLVLLNGVRMSDRTWGGKFIIRLDSINPHLIKRIEVIKGGQALFYGTRAVAGVINIVTKSIQPEGKGSAGFAAGTLDDRVAYADVSENIGKWDVMFFGNHNQGAFQPFKDNDIETPASGNKNEHNVTNLGIQLRRKFGKNRTLRIYYQKNDARNDRLRADGECFDCFNERDEDILSVKWDHVISDQTQLFLKGYWHNWKSRWTQINRTDTLATRIIANEAPWSYEDYGLKVMGKHVRDDGSEIMFGGDYQSYTGSDFSIRLSNAEETVFAGFLVYRPVLQALPKADISIGGRFTAPDRAEEKFVWNATAKHPLTQNTSFKFNVGSSYRLPSFMELFAQNRPAVALFPRVGNPNLDPEEGFNINLGLEGNHEISGAPVRWEATYFDREIEDLIVRTGGSGLFQNSSRVAEFDGYELRAVSNLTREWKLAGNYTLTDASLDGSSTQLNKIPEDYFKGKIRYNSPENPYGGQFTGLYTGTIRKSFVVNDQTYGDYFVGDLSLFYNLQEKNNSRLTLTVENIFDEVYASDIRNGTRVGGTSYRVERLGVPRNVQLEYRMSF